MTFNANEYCQRRQREIEEEIKEQERMIYIEALIDRKIKEKINEYLNNFYVEVEASVNGQSISSADSIRNVVIDMLNKSIAKLNS